MKYTRGVLLYTIILFSLLGCNKKEYIAEDYNKMSDNKALIGYVGFKEKNRILLVQNENFDHKDVGTLSLQEMIDKYKKVIFLGFDDDIDSSGLVLGKKIKAWYDSIAESNPPKATLLKIEFPQK
jgi:Protein of unknown function (DUF3221)